MEKLSKSKIELFKQCPAAFKFRYIDKYPPVTEVFFIGREIHRLVAEYAKHCVETKNRTDLDFANELINDSPEPLDDRIKDALKEFISSHLFIHERIVAVEEKLQAKIGKYIFEGVVDIAEYSEAEEVLIVTDYKSGFPNITQKQVEEDFSLSGYSFLLVVSKFPTATHIVKRLDFVSRGDIREAECEAETEIVRFKRRFLAAAKTIEEAEKKKEFHTNPGKSCATCGFNTVCYYKAKIKKIHSVKDAVEIGKELTVLNARRTALKNLLSSYCEKAGAVEVNNLIWDWYIQEKTKYLDKEKIFKLLKKKGMLWEALTFNKKKIEKELPGLIKKGLVKIDTSTSKFEAKVKKEKEKIENDTNANSDNRNNEE